MSIPAVNIEELFQRLVSIKRELSPAEKFFREALPARVANCEIREQQIKMALAVEQALAEGRHLVSEAGTGTGKSFAYLVPVIQHVKERGGRAVVSTGTIALQEQLMNKDIPFLRDVLGISFEAHLAKGKGNYLCLVRLDEELRQTALWADEKMSAIAEWAKETETGDRSELSTESGEAWGKICADDTCLGKKCPRLEKCFYIKARARLQHADLIVCNHALFFIDLMIKDDSDGFASVLPEYQVVVFDEAHHIETVAREAMGTQVSSLRLPILLGQLKKRPGCDLEAVQDALAANEIFFQTVSSLSREDKFLLPRNSALDTRGNDLIKAVRGTVLTFDSDFVGEREEVLFERLKNFNEDLQAILSATGSNTVFWAEVSRSGRQKVTLHATPIDISDTLSRALFNNGDIQTVIMTSATLSAGGTFNYFKQAVGCAGAVELQVDSPFDYYNQCLLYLPPGLPDPKTADFYERVTPFIEDILLKTDGRAFVLFTSYKGMNEVYDRLAGRLKWTVLKQGDMPKQRLLEAFKEDVHSVLFATASFWEGVDVQGEALSCVVLVKLPFAVPDDPVTEARIKAIEQAGGNAFFEYSVPEAIIRLKQGFGRLIRTRQDKGIVAILDPRVKSKGYGRRFLNSLPRCREILSLENVDLFLKGGR